MDIVDLLMRANSKQASDLHISANAPPVLRVNGELIFEREVLRVVDTEEMSRRIMTEDQWGRFLRDGEFDFALTIPEASRYRVNVYRERGSVSLAVRVIPSVIPAFQTLGLPKVLLQLADVQHGLVLVAGPTGSGKSTTLAALIQHINNTSRKHIITLENPIEFLHQNVCSVIHQREVGADTKGFASGLRAALRQDPDVILVGEMRDLETVRTAMTAAETGHLVFATLHTSDAVQTVERIVDVFPPNQQPQIRLQMATVLRGVIAQRLYKKRDGTGRVAAVEVLFNTPAVANLIRSEKTHQIRTIMQTSKAIGMQTMDMHIRELVAADRVSEDAVVRTV